MDLVECEAPLDNSFQKDRLELVNKGSLGRRRKPSRSNLRLILSPPNDRQIIDVFHNHHFDSDGSYIQEKASPTKILRESALDNHSKSVTVGKHFTSNNKFADKRSVSDNYRDVIGSIKQIYGNNCLDLNGNNQRTVSVVNNRKKFSSAKEDEESRCKQNSNSERKNNVNSKYHSQSSIVRNNQNGAACDHQNVIKLSNGHLPNKLNPCIDNDNAESRDISKYQHYAKLSNGHITGKYNCYDKNGDPKNPTISEDKNHCTIVTNGHLPNKSNHYRDHDVSENQKPSDYKNRHSVIINSKQTPKTHQNVITFSNHRQIITSTPVPATRSELPNGNKLISSSQDYSSKSYIEPSLPRTSKEPSLVEEARQFSVDAKLKRKNSDVQGRSAVLIQTWERRTQLETHSKTKKDSKTVPKNRFSEKENCDTKTSAMPDSYICTKYKGSLQNGDNLQEGELVSYVRDVRPDDTMLYRVPEDRCRKIPHSSHTSEVTVNGNSTVQEPEWISLSRKLCAKFVEGHVEPNSPDSYPHEEPDRVGEDLSSSPSTKKSHSNSSSAIIKTETQKNKTIPAVTSSEEADTSDEPPWIPLSRKLCNKFIEEHIEYPPITNGHFVEVPELVEPNGDIRIIEKIGKPKGHKLKQKKECEPEWVSLSKKLRAKFIESHIDDPDTIALDNQLNASDPEETSSETLSDISQGTAIPTTISTHSTPVECKNYIVRDQVLEDNPEFEQNGAHLTDLNYEENNEPAMYLERECAWEYQEMEFDQESNSGNFQELDYNDQKLEESGIQRVSFSQGHSNQSEERVTFSNSFFSRNSECFNNDVIFMPHPDNTNIVSNSPEQKKLITVQFVAHAKRDQSNDNEDETEILSDKQSTKNESFFNFSSWEVAHYQDEKIDDQQKPKEIPACKDFLSKSLDNLCDSLEEHDFERKKKRVSVCSADNFYLEKENLPISKKLEKKESDENFVNELDYPSSSTSFTNENNRCNCICERKSENLEENGVRSSNLVLQKEKEMFSGKNEVESSSEDEVFEYIPRMSEQSSSSSDSNNSRKRSPAENLKKKKHFNQSTKTPSPECLRKEKQSYQSRKSSSPENLMKEMHSYKSRKTPSPESLMKTMQSRKSPSPESLMKEMHSYKSRKTPSPESPMKAMQSRKTPSPESLTNKIQSNKIIKAPSSESLMQEIQSNQSRKAPSPENSMKERLFIQYSEPFPSENLKEGNQFSQSTELSSLANLKNEMPFYQIQDNKKKAKKGKNSKCNGMIPNSIYGDFPDTKTSSSKQSENRNNVNSYSKEPVKMGMSKWITMSKSEQNVSKPEYSNVQSFIHKEQESPMKSSVCDSDSNGKRKKNKINNDDLKENEAVIISKIKDSPKSDISKDENYHYNNINGMNKNTERLNSSDNNSYLQAKCKSLCDISRISNSVHSDEIKLRQHESIADLCSSTQTANHSSQIEFQHFESDSEIPLCAKLVSNHDKRISKSALSVTPSNRTESPCPSDSSHVYEDMFKETPSVPSDSETSWTVLKHNSYYVNGRSSSMNDLDFSDSCSMSMKCDYASSSESSTMQSRHSSYASSSFYVNLRDYDSHMLEPKLSKSKKRNGNSESDKMSSNVSKSNPPTPETLKHLFTSPLTSIHAPPHQNSRMLNRMPSDPQSHYYSTAAAATSSAFKHGFAPIPVKPKKTERSSSMKIKDIAHGIILTFKKLSKNSGLPSTEHVDVSHLAELKSNSELGKTKKDSKSKKNDKSYWRENGRNEFDSGFMSDVQRAKARRSSSDLTDWKSNSELFHSDKKKSKKKGGSKDKGKKNKNKDLESRTVPTVSRKVQQMADGTLYLVTTVSGDSTMPGVYSDSPDTSSELSGHRSVKNSGESNC